MTGPPTRRRRTRGTVLSAVILGLLTSGVLPTNALAGHCRFRGSKTIVNNRAARVFSIESQDPPVGGYADDYYGCLYSRGRRVQLAFDSFTNDGDTVAGSFVLSGSLVAFYTGEGTGTDPMSSLSGNQYVSVVDLRTRHIVHRADVRVALSGNGDGVHKVVLAPTGSVAWSDVIASGPEIHALGRSGPVVLDAGTGVDPNSLRLRGTTLSWIHGGEMKTATLN